MSLLRCFARTLLLWAFAGVSSLECGHTLNHGISNSVEIPDWQSTRAAVSHPEERTTCWTLRRRRKACMLPHSQSHALRLRGGSLNATQHQPDSAIIDSFATAARPSQMQELQESESTVAAREVTFTEPFPFDELFPLTPQKLAAAGFSFVPAAGKDDRCVCTTCQLALHGWKRTDDPFFEHLRWNRACPHTWGLEARVESSLSGMTPAVLALLHPARRWMREVQRRVPAQHATLNLALRACPYRHRLTACLAPQQHSLPTEVRFAAFHEVRVISAEEAATPRADDGTGSGGAEERRRASVTGTWWALPGSSGEIEEVHCRYASPAAVPGSPQGEGGMRACFTVWGGPWAMQRCEVRCAGELGLLCSQEGVAVLRECVVGGMSRFEAGKASSGAYVVQHASLVMLGSTLEHAQLYAVRVYNSGRATLDSTAIRLTDRAVGLGDDAAVTLRSCDVTDNAACVFHASSPAAGAKLHLTSCVIVHRGSLWLDRHRPGEVTEQQHLRAAPSVSVSTESISGPRYDPSQQQRPKRQRPAASHGGQFIPGTDPVLVTPLDWRWATAGADAPPT